MTAYELRRHLAAEHDVRMIGADYGTLVTVHDIEHRADANHTHDDPHPEAEAEAGHLGGLTEIFYLVILFLFILVLLRALRLV